MAFTNLAAGGQRHLQLTAIDAIAGVAGLAWKVKLGCQRRASWNCDLDVDVWRAPGIAAGHDRRKVVAAVAVGDLMTAESVAGIVVGTSRVCLPELQHRAGDRSAAGSHHAAGEMKALAGEAWLDQRGAQRRKGLEVGTLSLRRGRTAGAARRRRKSRLGKGWTDQDHDR